MLIFYYPVDDNINVHLGVNWKEYGIIA